MREWDHTSICAAWQDPATSPNQAVGSREQIKTSVIFKQTWTQNIEQPLCLTPRHPVRLKELWALTPESSAAVAVTTAFPTPASMGITFLCNRWDRWWQDLSIGQEVLKTLVCVSLQCSWTPTNHRVLRGWVCLQGVLGWGTGPSTLVLVLPPKKRRGYLH